MLVEALAAGKHVFMEKPLALNPEELNNVVQAYEAALARARDMGEVEPVVMDGLNRRYSPAGLKARELIRTLGQPAVIDYRVNAGAAAPGSWVHDPAVGGGRLVGEMCHSVDLVQFILSKAVVEVTARSGGIPVREIFCGGHVMTIDNFRGYRIVGPRVNERQRSLLTSAKGRLQELQDFVGAIQGGTLAFDWELAVGSLRTIFAIQQSLRTARTVQLG
jgi:predicted dehydrogenase